MEGSSLPKVRQSQGWADFKCNALPRKGESPGGLQKGTHKVCGGQGGSPVHGHSGRLMYGGGGGGVLSELARSSNAPQPSPSFKGRVGLRV